MRRKTVTFLDANVLIAAATGISPVAERAFDILEDTARTFASSALVKLETVPKAQFHKKTDSIAFYETFFEKIVETWAHDLNAVVDCAFDEAVEHDIAPRDALHIAAATAVGADELVTMERPTRPMFRTTAVVVRSLHLDADK